MYTLRSVTVLDVPSTISPSDHEQFLDEIRRHVRMERPRVVLDCDAVSHMSEATIFLLLCCLEEAMKTNGDLKLAGLNRNAEAALRSAGVHHLFEMFPTSSAAAESFHSFLGSSAVPHTLLPVAVTAVTAA